MSAEKIKRKRQYLFLFYLNNENEISIESSESRRAWVGFGCCVELPHTGHRNLEELKILPGENESRQETTIASQRTRQARHRTPIPSVIIGLTQPAQASYVSCTNLFLYQYSTIQRVCFLDSFCLTS